MGTQKFTNSHTHIFVSDCVPVNFLRIIPSKFLRKIAPQVLRILESDKGKILIKLLAKLTLNKKSAKRKMYDKYIAFLDVGLQNTQQEVLEIEFKAARFYDAEARVVALTLNMDYMDETLPVMTFETQLADVMNIKRYYPETFMPFLGIDPRHRSGDDAVRWAKKYFEKGVLKDDKIYPYFAGLKLYPALGYFPFDARLIELYKYAEENRLPVMTHTTRVGSQYIGKNVVALIPQDLNMIFTAYGAPANPTVFNEKKENIQQRITDYYKRGWIKNSDIGDNDKACDLFGHPENYIPIMELFPDLKICLAHMGGANEIDNSKIEDDELKMIQKADTPLWFDRIKEMMITYPNMYTDISYTLSSFADEKSTVLERTIELLNTADKNGNLLGKRVLFGTDFFMTEQEMREPELYAIARKELAEYWTDLTKNNPDRFFN